MRRIIDLIILAALVGAVIYAFKTPYYPCDTPISYKLGSIDPKFGISDNTVLSDIDSATDILSKVYGKNLFNYASDSGLLTVNFVYDERTKLDESVNKQLSRLDSSNANLQKQIDQYNADVKTLDAKFAELNATIQSYNERGGAPPEVYQQLIDQSRELTREGQALNARARELNLATKTYNTQVANLNSDVNEFNSALAQKPEEGLYNGQDKTITIYFADNKNTLIHTLAHEFGHALGMQHVEDPKAIMYKSTSEYLKMTTGDTEELGNACHFVPLFEHWSIFLRNYFSNKINIMPSS